MTYQDVISAVGDFGWFQKRLCVLLFFSTMTCALGTLTMIFSHYEPEHRCHVPDIDEDNFTENAWSNATLNLYIPDTDDGTNLSPHKCQQYLHVMSNASSSANLSMIVKTVSCQNGVKYDETNVRTVVTEFDLVCSRAWLIPFTVSIFMFGEAVGSFAGGWLADRFGRRRVLLLGKLIEFTLFFSVGFSHNFTMYIGLMAVVGAFVYLPYTTAFVLGNELMGMEHRNTLSLFIYGGYCTGAAVVPFAGYFISDWRWLMKAIGLLGVLYIPFYWLIPESPYWLLSCGYNERAKQQLEVIASINGKQTSFDANTVMVVFKRDEEASENFVHATVTKSDSGITSLLRSGTMILRIVVAYLSWIVTNMVYYGLALNISALNGDRYWNAVISGILEYPGIVAGFFMIQWIGRPRSLSLLMGFGGVCLAVAPFITTAIAATALVIIGKTALISSFYINFSITGEMSPTLFRNLIVGSCSAVGKIGSFTAPFLMFLGKTTSRFTPFLVMGTLALVSAVLSTIFLPETQGQCLPDTVKDAITLKPWYQRNEKRLKSTDTNEEMTSFHPHHESIVTQAS